MNTTAIVQKVVFSKLILSILKSHGNCTIIMAYKIENKREKLPNYQIEIADFCNIPIGNVQKLMYNFF